MPAKAHKKTTESIRTYFRTRASSQLTEEKDDDDTNMEHEQSKMAADNAGAGEGGAMAEVLSLIKGLDMKANKLDAKVTTGFESMNQNMAKLTDKVEALEFDVETVKTTQTKTEEKMQLMQEEMDTLKRSLLSTQAYARKYHLLLYGVDGTDTQPKDTIERVRRFAKESLKLEENYANKIVIRNAHRLQKRMEGPATIVIVFLYWSEREAFLRAGPNLRGTRMSVRTDLPPELKQLRGRLASAAYDIRQNEKIHARIREKGPDVWIETRRDSSSPWSRRDV
jgi:hypothetical protein